MWVRGEKVPIMDTVVFFFYKVYGGYAPVIVAESIRDVDYLCLGGFHFTGAKHVTKTKAAIANGL